MKFRNGSFDIWVNSLFNQKRNGEHCYDHFSLKYEKKNQEIHQSVPAILCIALNFSKFTYFVQIFLMFSFT